MSERIVSGYMTPQGGTVCVDCTGVLEQEYVREHDYFQIYEDSDWKSAPECGICRSVIKVIEGAQ
ncbi:hypothetical protein LCGC14_1149300 [marine sediment metagenome]|uniref:Uncharacterized protein n=1 Tax=marine sediment metagenome TaxID=412755 RepID=A0A0F9LW16_9ZZZZ|nr:hypothetical protein [Candidatus Aminicenantes bacterium]